MPVIVRKPLRPALLALHVLCAVSLGACGALPQPREPSGNATQAQREATLGARWRGQPYASLLQAWGPPRLVLRIPGERPVVSLAVLYGREDQAAACTDAFTIVQNPDTGAWSVADYFCR